MIAPPDEIIVEQVKDGRATVKVRVRELQDSEGNKYGGYGCHTQIADPKDLWTRKEKDQFRDFQRLKRKGLYLKMMQLYGTVDEQVMVDLLNAQMLSDPRLIIKTRRGLVKTTVELQSRFARQRAGPSESLKKT